MRRHRAGFYAFVLLNMLAAAPAVAQGAAGAQPEATQLAGPAQARRATPAAMGAPPASGPELEMRTRINNWAVTILGGYNTGVLIRMAVDIQTALEDGDNMRILPVVSHGAKQNVLDLLYLKGADIAITHA